MALVEEEAGYFRQKYVETAKAFINVAQNGGRNHLASDGSTKQNNVSSVGMLSDPPRGFDTKSYTKDRTEVIDMQEIDNIEQRSPDMFVKRAIRNTRLDFNRDLGSFAFD